MIVGMCPCRKTAFIRTRVVTVDTAKHFIITIETLFKKIPFSVHNAA